MLMAAMRLNIPAVFVSGGPMEAGEWNGQHLDLIDAMIKSADQSVSDEEVANIEQNACPTCGCCSGMFTANSMNWNRIGRTTHRNIQSHGIQKSLASGNATRKHALISLFIIFHRIVHNQLSCIFEKLRTVFMRGYNSPVSGKSQADGFVQAVHRICCKHTGTTSAGRTSVLLNIGQLPRHSHFGRPT